MLTIQITFPHRRYHATPWGHHVNEGVVEWPPSPWRILRALVACHHLKGRDLDADHVRGALEAMAAAAPNYALPEAVTAHTRHYMPLGDGESTTKVFDTFLYFTGDPTLEIHWPVDLEAPLLEAISPLVERMGYLGRAESWVEAEVLEEPKQTANVLIDSGLERSGVDTVRLLAPLPPTDIPLWRAAALDEHLTRALSEKRARTASRGKDASKVKLTKKEQDNLEQRLPRDVVSVLEIDTSQLQAEGWSRPPATRWLDYARPRSLVEPAPLPPPRQTTNQLPEVARFALASNVLPLWLHALSFGERVRSALMSLSGKGYERPAPAFSGKDAAGEPLAGHQHAYILPEAMDRSGHITHFVVVAPMGFDRRARAALQQLSEVRGGKREGEHLQQVVLLDMGTRNDFASLSTGSLFGPSKRWVSATPFVATRHPKRAQGEPKRDGRGHVVGSPLHDLERLLGLAGFPVPSAITPVATIPIGSRNKPWLSFQHRRTRGGGGRRADAAPTGFCVEFPEPVVGPIALGFGAHFGLGLFLPESAEEEQP